MHNDRKRHHAQEFGREPIDELRGYSSNAARVSAATS
jgi:hypothetical protein